MSNLRSFAALRPFVGYQFWRNDAHTTTLDLHRMTWNIAPSSPDFSQGHSRDPVRNPGWSTKGVRFMASLNLIQLTDLHLFPEPGASVGWCSECAHLDTDVTLQAVLDDIEHSGFDADAWVVTGDIAQQATPRTYQRAAEFLSRGGRPVYCLPGNHDEAAMMVEALQGRVTTAGHVVYDHWLLIHLDSSQPGGEEPAGWLHERELVRLQELLQSNSSHHVALFVHHPPVDVGSAWLDKIGLLNREALFSAIAGHPQVKTVVFGHAHQPVDTRVDGVRLLGAPSTCLQFKPGQATFAIDQRPPGWRWLSLNADGSLETAVRYLPPAQQTRSK